MAKIQGGVPVAGFIAPTDDTDVFAVTDEKYNRGGYRTVETLAERDGITDDRKKLGMIVYVWADKKIYQWDGNTWVEPSGFGDSLPFIVSNTQPVDGKLGDMWLDSKTGLIYTKREITDDTDPYNPVVTEEWVSDTVNLAQALNNMSKIFATKDEVSKAAKFNGFVDTKTDLPADPKPGDIYGVRDEEGAWYIYDEVNGNWEPVDGTNLDTTKVVNTDTEQEITGKKVFKGEVIVETDPVNPTDAVNLQTLTEKIADAGGNVLYNNADPTTATIGGIPAGTTFTDKSITDMFNMLLYPYQVPTITGVSTNYNTILEVGAATTNTISVTWTTSNQSNIKADSVKVIVNGVDVTPADTPLPKQGTQPFTITPLTRTSDGTLPVKVQITDVKNDVKEKTTNIVWKSAIYYGTFAGTSLTAADVLALQNKLLDDKFKRSYSFPGGGYKFVCYPARLGNATNFFNSVNNLPVPMEKLADVEVTNVNNVTQTYAVYRSTNVLGGAIDITFA